MRKPKKLAAWLGHGARRGSNTKPASDEKQRVRCRQHVARYRRRLEGREVVEGLRTRDEHGTVRYRDAALRYIEPSGWRSL